MSGGAAALTAAIQWQADAFRLDVDVRLDSGWLAVFGPSGSGKTTLLECVAGLRCPSAGEVRLGPRTLFGAGVDVPPRERGMGYVSQRGDLFPHLSVRRNLTFGQRAGVDFDEVVDMLEIADLLERKPDRLSGGQQQRVALGRALLSNPTLLLLDEPLAALDAALRRRILGYFARVKRRYATPCLYVTHSVSEVLTLADRVVLLEQGRQVEQGPPAAVLSSVALAEPLDLAGDGVETLLDLPVVDSVEDEGITHLALGGGEVLAVPFVARAAGETMRVSVRADDVILAIGRPPSMSARNVIAAVIEEMVTRRHSVYVRVRLGEGVSLWSHVTRAALQRMGLQLGMQVSVVLKSHSVRAV